MILSPIARADGGSDIVWTASKVSGTVAYRESGRDGVRWIPMRTGALLSSLAQIKTGPDGRAELTFEGSTIVAAPGSELHLPGPTPRNAVYRVSQSVGTFLYKIKHATRDKFEVQTPYLTTIIKGTVFTVLAGPAGSSVHVTEGAVFVRPSSGNGGAFIRPGETARVTNSARDRVNIQGSRSNGAAPGKPVDDGSKGKSSANIDKSNGDRAETPKGHPVKIVFREVQTRSAFTNGADSRAGNDNISGSAQNRGKEAASASKDTSHGGSNFKGASGGTGGSSSAGNAGQGSSSMTSNAGGSLGGGGSTSGGGNGGGSLGGGSTTSGAGGNAGGSLGGSSVTSGGSGPSENSGGGSATSNGKGQSKKG